MHKVIRPFPPYDMERVLRKCEREPLYIVRQAEKRLIFAVRVPVYVHRPGSKVNSDGHEASVSNATAVGETSGSWHYVVCILTSTGTVDHPEMELFVTGDTLTAQQEAWLMNHLADRFQWYSPALPAFYEEMGRSAMLAGLVAEYRGLPHVRYEGLFEGFIQTIVQQQVHFRFARQLVYMLAVEYGHTLEYGGHVLPLLPTPDALAAVDPAELHEQRKFSRRKAEYVTDLSKKIVSGDIRLEHLAGQGDDVFLEQMIKHRGIGRWTVECVQLFCLGKKDVFPAGDIGLQNAIRKLEGWDRRPTPEACLEWVTPHKDWSSYIAVYLWASLGE